MLDASRFRYGSLFRISTNTPDTRYKNACENRRFPLPRINQSDPHSLLVSTTLNNTIANSEENQILWHGRYRLYQSFVRSRMRSKVAAQLDRFVKLRGAWKNLATLPEKAFLGHYAAIITLISAESRVSKTISILMGGSRVNPFIGVGQIRIPLSLSAPRSRRAVERGSGTVAVR